MEFILCVDIEEDNTFEVYTRIQPPVWIANSVYFMDHDSEGRCYCAGYIYSNTRKKLNT